MVVLPAPFGPTTPTASPSSSWTLRLSITWRAPKRRRASSMARMGTSARGDRLELARGRDLRGGLVVYDDQLVGAAAPPPPLAADQRRLGHVGHRAARPVKRPHDRVQLGGLDGVGDRLLVVHSPGPLERVRRSEE